MVKTTCPGNIEDMKALDNQGLGHYKVVSNNKVYYKPLPTENNEELRDMDAFCNKNINAHAVL